MFRPRRLVHANLFVSDLERSMTFYQKVCGLREVFREEAIQAGFLSNGNTHHDLALMQASGQKRVGRDGFVQLDGGRGTKAGLNHFGFEMENERALVEAFKRARDAGVKVDRTADHQISRSAYLSDPDGNVLEFYADATDDWKEVFKSAGGGLITGAWDPGSIEGDTRRKYRTKPEFKSAAGAAFKPRRIRHAVLAVEKFDEAVKFYEDVIGLSRLAARDGYVSFAGTTGGYDIGILRAGPEVPRGLHHLGFEMSSEDDMNAAISALEQLGIQPAGRRDDAGRLSVAISDPDGIRLEFFFDRMPADEDGEAGELLQAVYGAA
jgi:catechol 2,3-dioxygenase